MPDGSTVREVALKLMAAEHAGADWAREAKVLASLRHPSLVTIFSAGLLDLPEPTPFVAMDLLEGRTLSAVLEERGALPWRRVLSLAMAIGSALDAVHAQGIIHLDLKPSNLLLGPDDVIRVLDFGIARQRGVASGREPAPSGNEALGTGALLDQSEPEESGRSTVRDSAPQAAGTPGFMAPEAVEGRDVGPAADAYALGVCMFQLITNRLPQRSRAVPMRGAEAAEVLAWRAEVRSATVAGELDELAAVAPTTPSAVVRVVRQLLSLDPALRPPSGTLQALLAEAFERPYGTLDPPYRGLEAYGQRAEGFLFGREADATRLARELETRPLLVLQGASGSGKSSLAVAGIVPALARSFADGCDDWVATVVRPGQDLDAAIRRARDGTTGVGVVLVVDQLEELVTQLAPEERARFVLAFARFASPSPRLRVLCTLREDFTTRVSALGSLGKLLSEAIRFVPPPSPASVRDIVVEPARLAGVTVDDEKPVVEDVLRELRSGEGRLPLISFALSEWWRTRGPNGLSAAAWREIGGVAGALSKHADATLAALDLPTQKAAKDIALALVTPEITRAHRPEKELVARGPEHARALAAFVTARLVTIDDMGSVSISHEALLSGWTALAGFIEEERAERVEAAGLGAAARLYRAATHESRVELLLRGARLARALDLEKHRPDLALPVVDLIRASQKRASRDAWVKNSVVFTLLLGAGAAVAFGAFVNNRHAEDIRLREENLRNLVRDAGGVRKDQERLAQALSSRDGEVKALKADVKGCKDSIVRVEQEHRAAMANRFPDGSFEHKLVTFMLQWEHVWNIHDADRVGTFFGESVDWFGVETPREVLAKNLATSWQKSPGNRLLLGEIAIIRREGGEATLRITRDERGGGTQNLAVTQFVVRGEKPEAFKIVKGTLERTIVSGKPLGCN